MLNGEGNKNCKKKKKKKKKICSRLQRETF